MTAADRMLSVLAISAALCIVTGRVALAYEHNLSIERTLSEILQDQRLKEAKARGDTSKRDVSDEEASEQQKAATEEKKPARRALLPDVGYSPETSGKFGVKFTDRDIRGLTLDVSADYAIKGQEKARFALVAPALFDGRVMLLAGGEAKTDPQVEFFGLGNNDVGPDELSTNRYTRNNARLAVAFRLDPRLLAVISGEFNNVRIKRGDVSGDTPSTVDAFPGLVGIHGGQTSPIGVALVYDDRDEVTRPIKGWNVIAKYQRVDKALGNRFEFNRWMLDASYLFPLPTRRQVLGIRAAGEYIDSRRRGTPFFELSALGGSDDMRGYHQYRFLGTSMVLVGGEYRVKFFDFDLFDWTNVKIDGVAFLDVGRVWLDHGEVVASYGRGAFRIPQTTEKVRVDGGPGLRFAFGEAIVARLDLGFSEESHGRAYFTFGHTF